MMVNYLLWMAKTLFFFVSMEVGLPYCSRGFHMLDFGGGSKAFFNLSADLLNCKYFL
jgi:hypothetical protein